jgi:hypothetical protein
MPLRDVGLKINQNNKNQCTYPAVLERLDPAAWMLLPADGWPEMTKLLVQGWLQAVFVQCNITLFMGCIWITNSTESMVKLLWYFSQVHLKRCKGQDTMNDTDRGGGEVGA